MALVIQVVSALYPFGTPSDLMGDQPPSNKMGNQGGTQSFPAFAFPMTCVSVASILQQIYVKYEPYILIVCLGFPSQPGMQATIRKMGLN